MTLKFVDIWETPFQCLPTAGPKVETNGICSLSFFPQRGAIFLQPSALFYSPAPTASGNPTKGIYHTYRLIEHLPPPLG